MQFQVFSSANTENNKSEGPLETDSVTHGIVML